MDSKIKEKILALRSSGMGVSRIYKKLDGQATYREIEHCLNLRGGNALFLRWKKSPAKKRSQPKWKKQVSNMLHLAIASGHVVRPESCEACGRVVPQGHYLQAHHDDYNKPLDVRFLCIPCHKKWHKNNEPIDFRPP